MKVPFLDYRKLYSEYPGVDDAMKRALVNGKLILGPDVEEFERKFAEFLGVKHVIGLNSGTDALLLSLVAAGVGPGDEVITVSHTFIATIQVIHHLGATPILVDVGEDGLMDMDQVDNAINSKTKAVIPVHLSGDVADMNRLHAALRGRNIHIIEDAAQAIGSRWLWFEKDNEDKYIAVPRMAGSMSFSGCFSFYPAKVLGTFGDAGAVATNDDAVAKRIFSLRNHGGVSKYGQDTYEFGWNSRMDNVWAAVLNEKLDHLPSDLKKREAIAQYYNEQLKHLPLTLPVNWPGRIWQDYVVRTEQRDELYKYMTEQGVGTLGADIIPNHLHPGLNLEQFDLPLTNQITIESLRIPCNHFMSPEDAEYVVKVIREFYGV